jgi:hypothetical protein
MYSYFLCFCHKFVTVFLSSLSDILHVSYTKIPFDYNTPFTTTAKIAPMMGAIIGIQA